MSRRRYELFGWGLLLYTLAVVLWGVVVRATGSGAGCGSDWPTCQGAVLPALESAATRIELFHRLTSSLTGLLAIVLVVGAFRLFSAGHRVRRAAVAVLLLTIVEGLIGAALVRLELVGDNASAARAIWMGLHLVNTLALLAALLLVPLWSRMDARPAARWSGRMTRRIGLALGLLLVTSAFGAVTALGDTLFPAADLQEGLRQDFDPQAHFTIQLRILHPLVALLATTALLAIMQSLARLGDRRWRLLAILLVSQLGVGVANIVLGAPLALQLIHLLLADLLWLMLVLILVAPLPAPTASQSTPTTAPRSVPLL